MLAVLTLVLAGGSPACNVYDNYTERISDETQNGCATITNSLFENLTNREGGAIRIKKYSSLNLTDSTFIGCHADNTTSEASYGGACQLGATTLQMFRCCGQLCYSSNNGQFVFLVGTDENGSVPANWRTLSQISVSICGGDNCDRGGVYLESPIAAEFRFLNITACQTSRHAAAFWAGDNTNSYLIQYLNVYSCKMMKSILWNGNRDQPRVEFANFYNNQAVKPVDGNASILYASGVTVVHGIFNGNSGNIFYRSDESRPPFVFDSCYFNSPSSWPTGATITRCFSKTTASYWIFAINTEACPGFPTASQSCWPSPTASESLSPTGSRSPSPSAPALPSSSPISFAPAISPSADGAPSGEATGLSAAAIAAVAVSAAGLLACAAWLLLFLRRRSRQGPGSESGTSALISLVTEESGIPFRPDRIQLI
jgi:hypothetical protein